MAKPDLSICRNCTIECETPWCTVSSLCAAKEELHKIYNDLRIKEKTELIKELRNKLDIVDYEVAEDLRDLAEEVIAKRPELGIIHDFNIRIAYLRSYEAKQAKGRRVNADCQKVSGAYTAFLPYDFIITFYEPNMNYMNENQIKILMLHELKHIGIGERGLRIENHDIEDFADILAHYGLDWDDLDKEVPDILDGGDNGKKKQGMASTRKTKKNS